MRAVIVMEPSSYVTRYRLPRHGLVSDVMWLLRHVFWCFYVAVLRATLRVLPVPPSVCVSFRLSVCLFVCPVQARNWKTKRSQNKIKTGVHVPHGTSNWSASFQLKRSKVKVMVRKISKIWGHVYLRAAAPADQARQAPTAN